MTLATKMPVIGEIGWIEFIVGTMFAGKTEELLRNLRRVSHAKIPYIVLKHSKDTRYGEETIKTHYGEGISAIPVSKARHIIKVIEKKEKETGENIQVVAIDEVQFFDSQHIFILEGKTIILWDIVEITRELANRGKRVILAGLDVDFRGLPFGPVGSLYVEAEYVTKLHALCSVCGKPAHRAQRIVEGKAASWNSPTEFLGGSDSYESRCRKCYKQPSPLDEDEMDENGMPLAKTMEA